MKLTIGICLALLGGAIILYGGGTAVLELTRTYRHALESPMDNPEQSEEGLSSRMLRGVYIGAAGIPPFAVGVFLVKYVAFKRAVRASRAARDRAQSRG